MGSSKPKKQTVGYKYYISLQLGLCHGTLGRLRSIWFGDKVAWTGNIKGGVTGQRFRIANEGLFGGDDSEGGVEGIVEFSAGSLDQELSGVRDDGTYAKPPTSDPLYSGAYSTLSNRGGFQLRRPPRATHYRGLAVLSLEDFYIGMNPYLKDISCEVERYWDEWYPGTAQIGLDANPAHIIYECCVNDQWGLGYDPELLNDEAMRKAALQLYNEGFGMSLVWSDQTSVEDFINEVISHIDGDFFFDQNLGQWVLRLVRDTDDVEFQFDTSNSTLETFTRRGVGEIVNQLYVKYVSRQTEEYLSVAIQDLASIESQETTASNTREYRGIREESLALRVCQRDLQSTSSTLATAELTSNRSSWDLTPGDIVTLSWEPYKIVSMRMRVTQTSHGNSESGAIRFSLIEDVFGKVDSVFGGGTQPATDNTTPAGPFLALAGWEAPYWYVAQVSLSGDLDPLLSFAGVLPVNNNPGFLNAEIYDAVTGERLGGGGDTPSGLTAAPLVPEVTSIMKMASASFTHATDINPPMLAALGSGTTAELVLVTEIAANGDMLIDRGLMDTVPREWLPGTRVYFIGTENFIDDQTARVMGTSVTYAVPMQTGASATPLESAQQVTVNVTGRQGRPYPPANVRVNGELWPEFIDATSSSSIEVSWSTRNRLLQVTDQHLLWDDASVTPEEGTTFNVTVIQNDTVLSTVTGVTGTSQTVFLDTAVSGPISIQVSSSRDGLASYQSAEMTFHVALSDEEITWPAVPFPGRRLALVGDSLVFMNTAYIPPGANNRFEHWDFGAIGFWTYAAQLMNHRLELEPGLQPNINGKHSGLNLGIAGSRIMNWWLPTHDTLGDGVLNVGPMYAALRYINAFDVALISGGTNDLAFNRTAGQCLADLKRAVSDIASKGKWVFVQTITPRTTDDLKGYTLAQQATIRDRIKQVNAGLRNWIADKQPPNVFLVDVYDAVVGPNGVDPAGLVSSATDPMGDSTLGNYRPEAPGKVFLHDGLHPSPSGAYAMGKVLSAAVIAAGVPARVAGTLGPYSLGPNILPNPTFTRTTTRPAAPGYSAVLGRALGLGPAMIDSTHAVGPTSFSNVGLGYQAGQVPDYWFFYRSSNSDDESYSNFSQYLWSDLVPAWPNLAEYVQDSTWLDGSAKTSITTVDGVPALRIDFRTNVTGNKNEAFVLRTMLPQGQHGPWDNWGDGGVIPNTLYTAGDQLAAEAEIRLSNIHGLHTARVTLEFLSVDTTETGSGDFSSSGAVRSGHANGLNFWPPSNIDRIRVHPEDATLHVRTPAVVVPTPATGENQQFARLNFEFACDASAEAASVTVIILAPSVNKLSTVTFPDPLPDEHGLGHDLGLNLGGNT